MAAIIENNRTAALKRNLLRKMLSSQVFKFGEFVLKSGQVSPVYIDLRECFGYSDLLLLVSEALASLITDSGVEYSGIVGVPYAALPYASVVSGVFLSKPLLITRKEAKSYGTKKLIEGLYKTGDRVVVIEDVVTTGGSLIDVVKMLRDEGLVVSDVYCILDREQGGREKLQNEGINMHSLLSMETILSFLLSTNAIDESAWHGIVKALNLKYTEPASFTIETEIEDLNKLPFTDVPRSDLKSREVLTSNPFNRKVLGLMRKKCSNLCLAIDYTYTEQVLQLAERAGPFVMAIKVHADAIVDFSEEFTQKLVRLAEDLEFVIFEDRKFADTGKTTELQLSGAQKVATWADVVTVHAVQGADSVCDVFKQFIANASYRLNGILLIAQLSTKGSLTALPGYTQAAVEIANNNRDVVSGFIAQVRVTSFSDLLSWTPGVNLDAKSDAVGQQWRGVDEAVNVQQNDIVIVGRGVTSSNEPVQQLKRYRKIAWDALMKEESS